MKSREPLTKRILGGAAQALGLHNLRARRGWLVLIALLLAAGAVGAYTSWLLPSRGEARVNELFLAHAQKESQGLRCLLHPNLNQMGPPEDLGVSSHLDLPNLASFPGGRKDNFILRWLGTIKVDKSGRYGIGGIVDDGLMVIIDGHTVLKAWRETAPAMAWGHVRLSEGVHAIEIRYLQLAGEATLHLQWQPPGKNREPLPADKLRPLGPNPPLGDITRLRLAYGLDGYRNSTYNPHIGGRFWKLPW